MEKFIPKEKLSKKKQRELNRTQRSTWGSLNPVTRKPANPKAYNRKKVQKGSDFPFEPSFLLMIHIAEYKKIDYSVYVKNVFLSAEKQLPACSCE